MELMKLLGRLFYFIYYDVIVPLVMHLPETNAKK
jgi:hypothetical protein